MKRILPLLTTALLCLGLTPARAQLGHAPGGPGFDGALAKVFGDNSAFTSTLVSQIKPKTGDLITMPGKIAFDAGQARFEMDVAEAGGLKMPPSAAAQMKAMGLDKVITITLPREKMFYLIYPGLQSYVKNPLPDSSAGTNQNFQITTTVLGKGTEDGHPCVENKVVVTDSKGATNEFTVWNATDLKNFPVKIFRAGTDADVTMSFKEVSLVKPSAAEFVPPANFTGYDSMQSMMQQAMMKQMGAMKGAATPAHP